MSQNEKSAFLSILIFIMFLLTGFSYSADHWDGDIFVLEADRTVVSKGNFSTSGAAKKFYKSNTDEYEMLIFFPNFSVGGSSSGTPVRNGTRGIGLELIEKGSEFGSAERLEIPVLISSFLNYPDDPYQHIGFVSLLSLIAHEVGHRWLAFPDVNHPLLDSDELLGRNKTHWSFFFNTLSTPMTFTPNPERSGLSPWTASSCEEGNYWVEGPANTFTATQGFSDGYSSLDQYLMGLMNGSDVGEMFVIDNPYNTVKTRESAPSPGAVVNGTRVAVSINDIIIAEGVRIPDANHSQRHYKQAFVLVVKAGTTPTQAEVAKLDDARYEWQNYYVPMVTEGRLTVDTTKGLNPVPIAKFTYTANGLDVTFDASASSDPDSSISTYYWYFGDGTEMETLIPTASHTYSTTGQYMVSLVISDGVYYSAPDTQPVNVGGGISCVVEITYMKYANGLEVRATTTRSPQDAHMVLIVQNGAFTANMQYNSSRKYWFYKGSVGFPPPYLIVVEDRLNPQSDPPPASGEPYCGRDEEYYGVPTAPEKPIVTSLKQAYPSPGNPEIWIPYQLGEDTNVEIMIHTPEGNLVRTLSLGGKQAGSYISKDKSAHWDGKNEAGEQVSSGIYFYTMQAGSFTATRKMIMQK